MTTRRGRPGHAGPRCCTSAGTLWVAAAGVCLHLISLMQASPLDKRGSTPLSDARAAGDAVLAAVLERAGGLPAGHHALAERMALQQARHRTLAPRQIRHWCINFRVSQPTSCHAVKRVMKCRTFCSMTPHKPSQHTLWLRVIWTCSSRRRGRRRRRSGTRGTWRARWQPSTFELTQAEGAGHVWQEAWQAQTAERRARRVARAVAAAPEAAQAAALATLAADVAGGLPELELHCAVATWMLQEAASLVANGARWSAAQVPAAALPHV